MTILSVPSAISPMVRSKGEMMLQEGSQENISPPPSLSPRSVEILTPSLFGKGTDISSTTHYKDILPSSSPSTPKTSLPDHDPFADPKEEHLGEGLQETIFARSSLCEEDIVFLEELTKESCITHSTDKAEEAVELEVSAASLRYPPIYNLLPKLDKLRTLEISFPEDDLVEELHLEGFKQLTGLKLSGKYEKLSLYLQKCPLKIMADEYYPHGKITHHYVSESGTLINSKTARGIAYKTNMPLKNYNMDFSFRGRAEKYSCRHAVMDDLQITDSQVKICTTRGKTYKNRAAYRNSEIFGEDGIKIPDRPVKLEEQIHILRCFSKDNYIVSHKNWDEFSIDQFKQMQKEIDKEGENRIKREFIAASEKHVMTFRLVMKKKEDICSYAISLFDPNETTTNTRIDFDHIEDIGTTGALCDILLMPWQKRGYFGDEVAPSVTLFIRATTPCTAQTIEALKEDSSPRQLTYYGTFPLHSAFLQRAMAADLLHLDTCQELLKKNIDIIKDNPDLLLRFLSAKDLTGVSSFYFVLERGDTKSVKAYLDVLVKWGTAKTLTPEQMETLLAARDDRGIPGLHMALQEGHTEIVKAYLDALVKLGTAKTLTPEQMETLLAARDDRGIPGLHMALQEGHTEIVKAYLDALVKLGTAKALTPAQIETLLAARDDQGISGLQAAMEHDRTKTVRAYVQAIATSPYVLKD